MLAHVFAAVAVAARGRAWRPRLTEISNIVHHSYGPVRSYIRLMTSQTDLFAPTLLPGLKSGDEFISPDEEDGLIAAVDGMNLAPFRFQGWLGKRLTVSYGWHYDFEMGGMARAGPLPDFLLALRKRAATFAGMPDEDFVQVLLTRYDPGAGIGWHRDRPLFEHVIGISLGTTATLRFRRRRDDGFDRGTLLLQPRSIYCLSDEARWKWEHSITPMMTPRWSITFRSLSDRGRVQTERL